MHGERERERTGFREAARGDKCRASLSRILCSWPERHSFDRPFIGAAYVSCDGGWGLGYGNWNEACGRFVFVCFG